jgi:hypothetical protein
MWLAKAAIAAAAAAAPFDVMHLLLLLMHHQHVPITACLGGLSCLLSPASQLPSNSFNSNAVNPLM